MIFAPAGRLIPHALRSLRRGGVLAINAVYMDEIPAMDYGDLYWERTVRSVANATRDDARELMELAARIPLHTNVQIYPFEKANEALADLKHGSVNGAAVLQVG